MAISVISRECNDRQGTIIVQADKQEEASSADARHLALQAAAESGLSKPGISGNASVYPVDADGVTSDELMMGQGSVAGYRCDFPVTAGL